jgi:Zn-finger nucleic acid-binding protein
MQCPRCVIYLNEDWHKDVRFYSCPECCGTWFLKKDLKKAGQPEFVPKVMFDAEATKVVHKDVGQTIRCPVGGHAPMKRVFRDYVHVDVCKEHEGVWLDGGELKDMRGGDYSLASPGDKNWTTKDVAIEAAGYTIFEVIFDIVFSVLE